MPPDNTDQTDESGVLQPPPQPVKGLEDVYDAWQRDYQAYSAAKRKRDAAQAALDSALNGTDAQAINRAQDTLTAAQKELDGAASVVKASKSKYDSAVSKVSTRTPGKSNLTPEQIAANAAAQTSGKIGAEKAAGTVGPDGVSSTSKYVTDARTAATNQRTDVTAQHYADTAAYQAGMLDYHNAYLNEKSQNDFLQRQMDLLKQDILAGKATAAEATSRFDEALNAVKAAPWTVTTNGQTYLGGYEPGGVMSQYAKMDGRSFSPVLAGPSPLDRALQGAQQITDWAKQAFPDTMGLASQIPHPDDINAALNPGGGYGAVLKSSSADTAVGGQDNGSGDGTAATTKGAEQSVAPTYINAPQQFVQMAIADAQKYGVNPDIFVRQINQESGFDPTSKSKAGALGIAQFMPGTAAGLGINPMDPAQSLDGAARLMGYYLKKYGGDYAKALAAYNAGEGAVDQYGGVPPYGETQSYVKIILGGGKPILSNQAVPASSASDGYGPSSSSGSATAPVAPPPSPSPQAPAPPQPTVPSLLPATPSPAPLGGVNPSSLTPQAWQAFVGSQGGPAPLPPAAMQTSGTQPLTPEQQTQNAALMAALGLS